MDNMIEIASGTLELQNNRWPNLRRVLEMILPHWLDSTILGGKGIQLFLLSKISDVDFGNEKFPPVFILRAKREGYDPKQLKGYVELPELRSGIHIDYLMGEIGKIFEDVSRMKVFWDEEESRVHPNANLGQGDGTFRSYKIVYSTWYYDTHMQIFLSHHYTPA